MSTIQYIDPVYHIKNIPPYAILKVDRASDQRIFEYKIDYNLMEYLSLFNWIIKPNLTIPKMQGTYLNLGVNDIHLYKVILGIDPILKNLNVIFLDGDNLNYTTENLKVLYPNSITEVPYYTFQYWPMIRNPIAIIDFPNIEIYGNYIINFPIRRYSADLSSYEIFPVQINYKYYYNISQYQWKIYTPKNKKNNISIITNVTTSDGVIRKLHLSRFIMSLTNPEFDPIYDKNNKDSLQLIHLDNNPLNNTIENLRIFDPRDPLSDPRMIVNNSTGHRYIYKNNDMFKVEIYNREKPLRLGTYATLEEAINVRDMALQALKEK